VPKSTQAIELGGEHMRIRALGFAMVGVTAGWCSAAVGQTGAAASDNSSGNTTLGEVVVTAERRRTDLQQTPIAATVLSGGDLANMGVVTVDQLMFATPGATVNNFGQGTDFDIRGIGKGEHNSQTSTGVITYRDGVATFPGYFQEEPYFDVASIEILRGPQGTFGGQNATGGAVLVTTNDPVINGGFHGYVQGQVGNYSDGGVQGAVNLPISDTFAARFAFDSEYRESFYKIAGPDGGAYDGNPGNLRAGAARLSLLWQPDASFSVLLKNDYDYLNMGAYPADPYYANNDLFDIGANSPQQALDRFGRSILKINYVLPDGITLRSVSGYQKGVTDYVADLDGTNYLNDTFGDSTDETLWSEEFNVISPDTGFLTWVLGGYIDHDKYTWPAPYTFYIGEPPGNPATEYLLQAINPTQAVAGFGQVSFQMTSSLQLQIGARYTAAETSNHGQVLQFGVLIPDNQSAKYVNTSGKVSLNWTIDPNNFVYAFVSTGFKPGGLNVPVGLGQPNPFGPETLTDYELGWKLTSFDGHLRSQFGSFYYNYKNFQVNIGYPQFPTFEFELNNPNPTHLYGFEAQTEAAFGALSFNAGTTIMHSSLGTFFATDPRIVTETPCNPTTGPSSPSCIDLGGHQQTYAPDVTFTLGAQYKYPLPNGDSLTPRINYAYISPQWATLFENSSLGDHLAGRDISGAQIAYQHGHLIATVYGTNLSDQHYVAALNSNLRFAGYPRQYGLRIFLGF
jgi:iron complex outermembrane receptor protein